MDPRGSKPWLFLDVDGVLCLTGPIHPGQQYLTPAGIGVYLSDGATSIGLAKLLECFDGVWCTSWRELAPTHLAPILGIDPLPVLSLPRAEVTRLGLVGAKRTAIESWLTHHPRPFCWIDDDLDSGAQEWVVSRPRCPGCAIRPDTVVGLTLPQIERALSFGAGAGPTA